MSEQDAISVRFCTTPQMVAELEPCWHDLLEASGSRSVFLTWEWVDTWLRHYHARFDPFFLVAIDRGRPAGIVPIVRRTGTRERHEFLGQNRAFGEYLDFIVPAEEEPRVAAALAGELAALCERGVIERMNLGVVRQTSPNLPVLLDAFQARGLPLCMSAPRISPVVALPSSWDAYIQAKGRKLGKRIAYNRRRLESLGEVSLEIAGTPDELHVFFDEFVELHNARWQHQQDQDFIAFHRELAGRFLARDALLMARLRVGGRTAAVKYDFIYDRRIWGYQGGWLPEMGRLEIGNVLICELFQHGIASGLEAYDFLEGDDWYKRRWSTAALHSVDLSFGEPGGAFVF